MGRKSRMKRERRFQVGTAGQPEVGSRREVIRDAMTQRVAAAESRALAAAQLADPGPHISLSEQLRARRAERRDRLATGAAAFWASGALLAELLGGTRSERPLDLEGEVFHELDARVAWDELLAVQDADPDGTPDLVLCRVVAECEHVERDPHLDPLLDGTSWPSMELAERLNATSSPTASSSALDIELVETAARVALRCGERAPSLLNYVAAEALLHFQYPEGCWSEAADLVGGLDSYDGAIDTWAAAEHVGRAEAVALAVRLAAVLAELSVERVGMSAISPNESVPSEHPGDRDPGLHAALPANVAVLA